MQDKMIEWYKSSLDKFGKDDYRSLTWGDKEGTSAKKRYEQMSEYVNFEKSSIYEIGCGWGSFFDFGFKCKSYFGIDIMNDFIDIANSKYTETNKKFVHSDINIEFEDQPKFDVSISSGVAGNRGGPATYPEDLYRFLKHMLDNSKMVMVNFPSIYATIRSDNVEYFSPSHLLSTALQVTENVELIHKHRFDTLLILREN
jgi:SAM-dependent methyltransferase